MSSSPINNEDNKPPLIRRGRVESVDLYEIKETELDLFEKGSPADLHLNFCIFLFSIAFSAIIALVTATFVNSTIHITFIVVAVVGILMGTYLAIAWLRGRKSVRATCMTIRRRIKETTSVDVINKTTLAGTGSASPPEQPGGAEPNQPKG
jgi:hypothetical protein